MRKTECCNHRFVGDNHSPIRPDGYCLYCGFHYSEIESLKERIRKLELMIEHGLGWEDMKSDGAQGEGV